MQNSLIKLNEVFICARACWKPQLSVNNHEAKCINLLIVRQLLLFCIMH